jgi:hypothetical protein
MLLGLENPAKHFSSPETRERRRQRQQQSNAIFHGSKNSVGQPPPLPPQAAVV